MALHLSAAGFHPVIVPSSVANMNRAGPEPPLDETVKSEVPLNTAPVGVPEPLPPVGGGIMIAGEHPREIGFPLLLYSVVTPALLSEIQKGPVGGNTMPQGLMR